VQATSLRERNLHSVTYLGLLVPTYLNLFNASKWMGWSISFEWFIFS